MSRLVIVSQLFEICQDRLFRNGTAEAGRLLIVLQHAAQGGDVRIIFGGMDIDHIHVAVDPHAGARGNELGR